MLFRGHVFILQLWVLLTFKNLLNTSLQSNGIINYIFYTKAKPDEAPRQLDGTNTFLFMAITKVTKVSSKPVKGPVRDARSVM